METFLRRLFREIVSSPFFAENDMPEAISFQVSLNCPVRVEVRKDRFRYYDATMFPGGTVSQAGVSCARDPVVPGALQGCSTKKHRTRLLDFAVG